MRTRTRRSSSSVLAGGRGPARDVVLLNAGASLFIAGAAASIVDGIARAARAIDGGDAKRTLERMIALSKAEEIGGGGVMGRTCTGLPRTCWRPSWRPRGESSRCENSASRCPRWPRGRRGGRRPPGAFARARRAPRTAGDGFEPGPQRVPRIIAECKRRSPSRGVLQAATTIPVAIATGTQQAGAAAISVLTEPTFFDGALDHLQAVRRRRRRCPCCARTSSSPSTSCSRRAPRARMRCS